MKVTWRETEGGREESVGGKLVEWPVLLSDHVALEDSIAALVAIGERRAFFGNVAYDFLCI